MYNDYKKEININVVLLNNLLFEFHKFSHCLFSVWGHSPGLYIAFCCHIPFNLGQFSSHSLSFMTDPNTFERVLVNYFGLPLDLSDIFPWLNVVLAQIPQKSCCALLNELYQKVLDVSSLTTDVNFGHMTKIVSAEFSTVFYHL